VNARSDNVVPVLFLNSPESFGADTWIQALLMRHLDERFEVHAACAKETASWKKLAAIPRVRLRPTRFTPTLRGRTSKMARAFSLVPAAFDLFGLAGYVREHRIRLLHASDRPRDAITCALLAKLTGARAVVHVHVKYDSWITGSTRRALRSADALVGVSAFVSRSLVKGGYRPERVHTVLNAIDPAAWNPDCSQAEARTALGLPLPAKVIACVSRLFHWKGQRELIRALALVRDEFPAVRLLLVGAEDALAGGPRYELELKALVDELGLAGNVLFLGRRSDVARMMAASDVFCLPSFEEPFGLVFAEAMAMRRPVVALDNGGTPEVVENGKTGLLVSAGDIEALARSLLLLLKDAPLRARMGGEGRQRVEALFAPRQLAKAMAEVYDRLVQS
jgi:glycosyltransferase involved in cell wall biosynthesis